MVSISGVRGVVGHGLTPEVVVRLAAAFGSSYGPGKVIVGRDTRPSGPMVRHAVLAGLMATGCEVIDMGVCPTPTVLFTTGKFGAAGGVVITASHNSVEWNALKFVSPRGGLLTESESSRLYEVVDGEMFAYGPVEALGSVVVREGGGDRVAAEEFYGLDRHLEDITALDFIDVQKIKERKLRVVVDCCDGAGKVLIPRLVGDLLDCEVVAINCSSTDVIREFPHPPEPLPENLGELCQAVVDEKADIGFASDPDADRLAIVSDKGVAIGEEYTLALATKYVLAKRRGRVVVNMSTSRMVEDIAREYGCQVERTPVGEIHVGHRLVEVGGVIGGEGNGGVIVPDLHLGRDALLAIALVLQLLAEREASVTEVVDELPRYAMAKHKVTVEREKMDWIIDELGREFEGRRVNRLDGLRIDEEDHWLHIRKSNTEPIIRVIVEARTELQARELTRQMAERIGLLANGR